MDKRFLNLFNLTEEQAIALLDTPYDQVSEDDSRYIATSHLINFSSENSIQALIRAVQQTDPALENRIVRRKSVETLGRLEAKQALPVIRTCLTDDDCYTVENAVWSIGEIGTQDAEILEEVAQLLETFPEAGMQGLKIALNDANPVVHIAATMALGEIGVPSLDILIEALETTDNVGLAVSLVNALASVGDSRGAEVLTALVNDESADASVQESATSALSRLEMVSQYRRKPQSQNRRV
ncbi:MAG: HEAT repeat domain-containing protein [Timaviella obliquedivisa GSE-PSE-MK23-08B]|jgi:HEAT repeat protein|nr:HEAT repeat domain-containing protein [Timaviella obliquedivisa GSE-PSE-MK23-08B]